MLITTGMQVPASFPAASYDSLHKHMVAGHNGTPAYKKYGGGWNAVSHRYAEALECAGEFEQYFISDGAGPPPAQRYQQERAIFDFYGSAVSTFEACAYAIFAIASINHA